MGDCGAIVWLNWWAPTTSSQRWSPISVRPSTTLLKRLRCLANAYLMFHKAYTSAAAGDTINLAGTFTWTDVGETGDAAGSGYTLGKNLTIVGQTTATTIVQAAATRGAADRMVFYVGANVTVGFRDLTIRYGKVTGEGQGAGITLAGAYCGFGRCPTITGTATLDRVAVTMNDAAAIGTNTMYRAGGIYMQEASTQAVRTRSSSKSPTRTVK